MGGNPHGWAGGHGRPEQGSHHASVVSGQQRCPSAFQRQIFLSQKAAGTEPSRKGRKGAAQAPGCMRTALRRVAREIAPKAHRTPRMPPTKGGQRIDQPFMNARDDCYASLTTSKNEQLGGLRILARVNSTSASKVRRISFRCPTISGSVQN